MNSFVSFIKSHKFVPTQRIFDEEGRSAEDELVFQIKYLWTVAFQLSLQPATAPVSPLMLHRLVELVSQEYNLPISFWKRVCPHCLSFYHSVGYDAIEEGHDEVPAIASIVEMDKMVARNAPQRPSAQLGAKKAPFIIFICNFCSGGAKWTPPAK